MIYMEFLKSFSEPILRYGNPDSKNLGTLKYKIQININEFDLSHEELIK